MLRFDVHGLGHAILFLEEAALLSVVHFVHVFKDLFHRSWEIVSAVARSDVPGPLAVSADCSQRDGYLQVCGIAATHHFP